MGSWSHTFWDNDNCCGLLRLFFIHLGFMEYSSLHSIVQKTFPGMGTLILRSDDKDLDRMQLLLYTLDKETVKQRLAQAPDVIETFKRDIMTLEKHYLDATGVSSIDTFWTLLRMHFGMAVPVEDLDKAAQPAGGARGGACACKLGQRGREALHHPGLDNVD